MERGAARSILLKAPSGRPVQTLLQPVVAPEDLAVPGHEARRADDSELGRARTLGFQRRLIGFAFGAGENGFGVEFRA